MPTTGLPRRGKEEASYFVSVVSTAKLPATRPKTTAALLTTHGVTEKEAGPLFCDEGRCYDDCASCDSPKATTAIHGSKKSHESSASSHCNHRLQQGDADAPLEGFPLSFCETESLQLPTVLNSTASNDNHHHREDGAGGEADDAVHFCSTMWSGGPAHPCQPGANLQDSFAEPLPLARPQPPYHDAAVYDDSYSSTGTRGMPGISVTRSGELRSPFLSSACTPPHRDGAASLSADPLQWLRSPSAVWCQKAAGPRLQVTAKLTATAPVTPDATYSLSAPIFEKGETVEAAELSSGSSISQLALPPPTATPPTTLSAATEQSYPFPPAGVRRCSGSCDVEVGEGDGLGHQSRWCSTAAAAEAAATGPPAQPSAVEVATANSCDLTLGDTAAAVLQKKQFHRTMRAFQRMECSADCGLRRAMASSVWEFVAATDAAAGNDAGGTAAVGADTGNFSFSVHDLGPASRGVSSQPKATSVLCEPRFISNGGDAELLSAALLCACEEMLLR